MAEVINLRTARKQAARKAARTKAERALSEARAAKAARDLDAHRRDPSDEQG